MPDEEEPRARLHNTIGQLDSTTQRAGEEGSHSQAELSDREPTNCVIDRTAGHRSTEI